MKRTFLMNIYGMFCLKRNSNYSGICKLWWNRYNETNELFSRFYLRTYRTSVQQMLKMSTTFSKTSIHPFSVFRATLRSVSESVLETLFSTVFQFLKALWVIGINSWERTHVLLVNMPCSHLYSFWREREQRPSNQGWPWLECHGGGWESLSHCGGPASDLIFVP
jgi:hypothetical protein